MGGEMDAGLNQLCHLRLHNTKDKRVQSYPFGQKFSGGGLEKALYCAFRRSISDMPFDTLMC